jgi:multidrug efflux pump subunit AcrA (membrane-fusion protein)
MIDRKAIIESLKKPEVYVVKGNRAYKQAVTTGKTLDNYITVAGGLNEGDTVVIAGQINLTDGREVAIVR